MSKPIQQKQWAKLAYSYGYTSRAIGAHLGITHSTISTWQKKEGWKRSNKPITELMKKRLNNRTIIPDENKKTFPSRSMAYINGNISLGHGIHADSETIRKDIEGEEAQNAVCATVPLVAEKGSVRGILEPSPDIIAMDNRLKVLAEIEVFRKRRIREMKKALKKDSNAEETTHVTIQDNTTEGINAGKEVSLKEQKREKQAVRLRKHIQMAYDDLEKTQNTIAAIVEKRAKIVDMEEKRAAAAGMENNDTAVSMVNALGTLASKVKSGHLTLEDDPSE